MTKIVDRLIEANGGPVVICDFSPPRSGSGELLQPAEALDADYISVAYNPGKSTRVNSVAAAHWIKTNTDKDVVFTLATRDMNRLAIQSLLLGAQLLGLENVVVVKGDDFSSRELAITKAVGDLRPTQLISSITALNQGIDYKELKLRSPTDFCVGASIDLGKGIEKEVPLTRSKVQAGAQFFISQPTFDSEEPTAFLASYAERYGEELAAPLFHGVQVMTQDSIVFGNVPAWVTDDLGKGRTGADIAMQVLDDFANAGFRSIYLVPPILRGGRRDYEAAQGVLEQYRG